jgi:hypothetical protein
MVLKKLLLPTIEQLEPEFNVKFNRRSDTKPKATISLTVKTVLKIGHRENWANFLIFYVLYNIYSLYKLWHPFTIWLEFRYQAMAVSFDGTFTLSLTSIGRGSKFF